MQTYRQTVNGPARAYGAPPRGAGLSLCERDVSRWAVICGIVVDTSSAGCVLDTPGDRHLR